jgi:hypothetical protein
VWSIDKAEFRITLSAAGELIPGGEEVYLKCIDEEGANEAYGTGKLGSNACGSTNNTAIINWDGPVYSVGEWWDCAIYFYGDGEFGPSFLSFKFTP